MFRSVDLSTKTKIQYSISIIKICIVALTISSGFERCCGSESCVTVTTTCELREGTTNEILLDSVSFGIPYNMRLFNKTIMVLEYILPSTAEVVSKYVSLPGIKTKARLMMARPAVQG